MSEETQNTGTTTETMATTVVAPNIEPAAFLAMKVEEFFSKERFEKHGVRVKFTRARILHFLDQGRVPDIGRLKAISERVDLSLGRDFGKKSYEAMVKILGAEGIHLHKHEPVRMPVGWRKTRKREAHIEQNQGW